MILFVFEADKREPSIYKTLERLFFPRINDNIICSFGNNIYELFNEMNELDGDGDIVSVMKELLEKRGDDTLNGMRSSYFSEIFLFFDYDFQHSQLTIDEINQRMSDMLALFKEETEYGKLYINYPMIESIRYVKELPDDNYWRYTVSREECSDFKRLAREFSYYDSFDFMLFREDEKPTREKYHKVKDNWQYLMVMNVSKANYIVTGENTIPNMKSVIDQRKIYEAQKEKYISINNSVAILNSFPLFIYEYFK